MLKESSTWNLVGTKPTIDTSLKMSNLLNNFKQIQHDYICIDGDVR